MDKRTFVRLDKELLVATILTKKMTGEVLKITAVERQLYSWFLSRYKFWRSQDKIFHDNQEDIAKANGMSRSTVKRFVKEFSSVGVIIIGIGNSVGGKRNSNNYIVVDIYESSVYTLS